jgi:hypothetical protein
MSQYPKTDKLKRDETNDSCGNFIVVRRRRMTLDQHKRLRLAARKMLQDFRKFCKRKGL